PVAAAPVPEPPPTTPSLADRVRARLAESLAAAKPEPAAAPATPESETPPTTAKTDVELETAKTKLAEQRAAYLDTLLADVNDDARDFAKFKIGEVDPFTPEGAKSVDDWKKANPTHLKPSAVVPRDGKTEGRQQPVRNGSKLLRVVAGGR
ncbi:MAG: hypothetical protein H6698_09585, partial [Myxococcales bacterium]|nr:hypothetical protein [Myxococcales bacterium]MCB9534533.1 hypothetical protein [Myxococcales bacterium]